LVGTGLLAGCSTRARGGTNAEGVEVFEVGGVAVTATRADVQGCFFIPHTTGRSWLRCVPVILCVEGYARVSSGVSRVLIIRRGQLSCGANEWAGGEQRWELLCHVAAS